MCRFHSIAITQRSPIYNVNQGQNKQISVCQFQIDFLKLRPMAAIWYCLEFISLPKKAFMKYVTESSIDTALEKMESFGDAEIESIFDDFSAKQPAILAFILSNEEAMTEDEFNILLELSLIMYMAFYAESAELREVSETELETIIDIAVKKYEELDEEDDDAMNEAVENAVETANQPLLFQFLMRNIW